MPRIINQICIYHLYIQKVVQRSIQRINVTRAKTLFPNATSVRQITYVYTWNINNNKIVFTRLYYTHLT